MLYFIRDKKISSNYILLSFVCYKDYRVMTISLYQHIMSVFRHKYINKIINPLNQFKILSLANLSSSCFFPKLLNTTVAFAFSPWPSTASIFPIPKR